jgi:glycosyltransferase involved in cell wall biosynthesis
MPFYGINMTWPRDIHRHRFPRGIGFTMFETTHPPKEWSKCLNICRRIIVPCQQNKQAFEMQGTTTPIHVVPLGVNPDKWPTSDRRKLDGPFTFLMAAGITMRKNPIDCVNAFIAAFPRNAEVRLVLKTRGMEASPGRDTFRMMIESALYVKNQHLLKWSNGCTSHIASCFLLIVRDSV